MIIELEQYTARVDKLRSTLREVGEGLHIDQMERELTELHEEMNAEGFWDNLERSTHVNRRISSLEGKIKHYQGLLSSCDDVEAMIDLARGKRRRHARGNGRRIGRARKGHRRPGA